MDARESRFLDDVQAVLARVREEGGRVEVLFLDCDDKVLQRRYSETRRRHPLSLSGSVVDGIAAERGLLGCLRVEADRVIDTTGLNPHQLRQIVQDHFSQVTSDQQMGLAVMSFGFKHGIPPLCDLVFDVRFLPNPYFVPELRERLGTEAAVSDFVMASPEAGQLIDHVLDFLRTFRPHYDREGKSYLTVGIGCTGGRHRSVAIAEAIGQLLTSDGAQVVVRHRDAERA